MKHCLLLYVFVTTLDEFLVFKTLKDKGSAFINIQSSIKQTKEI